MPVELSPFVVRRTLAALRAEDREAAVDVEGALQWLDERADEAEPLLLRRYDLQLFLWYQLPRKLLAPLERKQAVADALGRFLDRAGAPGYAALCRSEETRSLLCAWEEGDGQARERFRRLLDVSGLEPPDTALLEWGSVMGPVEARLHDAVAYALENAVEEGRLVPGQAGFERAQTAHVETFLRQPRADLDGRTPLAVIHEERIERWSRRGSEKRRELVLPLVSALREPAPGVPSAAIESALEPLLWLLGLAEDGLELTQTGALSRDLVRTAAARYPGWWDHKLHGPPHREDDVAALRELDDLARRMRLLRRRGRKLFLTRRGAALRRDPAALLEACARSLLSRRPFAVAVQELAAALLLAEQELEWDALDARVHGAIVADGWNAAGQPPELRDIRWIVADLVRPARALGLLRYEGVYPEPRRLVVTEPGRAALRAALRERATEPATSVI